MTHGGFRDFLKTKGEAKTSEQKATERAVAQARAAQTTLTVFVYSVPQCVLYRGRRRRCKLDPSLESAPWFFSKVVHNLMKRTLALFSTLQTFTLLLLSLLRQYTEERLRARYHAECSAVAALAEVVRDAVDAQVELEADLVLVQDDLIVDEDTRAVPVPDPQPLFPPVEPEPAPGVFTCKQFAGVAAAFAAVRRCRLTSG